VAEDSRVYTDDANKFKISIPQGTLTLNFLISVAKVAGDVKIEE
jgi:hypothetical protein